MIKLRFLYDKHVVNIHFKFIFVSCNTIQLNHPNTDLFSNEKSLRIFEFYAKLCAFFSTNLKRCFDFSLSVFFLFISLFNVEHSLKQE